MVLDDEKNFAAIAMAIYSQNYATPTIHAQSTQELEAAFKNLQPLIKNIGSAV
jgi:hypothetical protein